MFGGGKEDIVGKTIWDLSAKRQIDGSESQSRARELIRNALDGEIQIFEWQHIRLDGTPFDAEVGLSRLELPGETVLLAIIRDITERKKVQRERERLIAELTAARESLQFQASHDKLSGLWNRSAILETLGKELARSVRSGKPVGLVLADIDCFKQVNDEYGHLAGDAVLREVSEKLEASIRPYDYVGRYGGDEFVIVLPGCGPEEAHHMAERIRELFNDNTLRTSEGDFRITMSLGVIAAQGVSAGSVDALIRSVDEALYRAKQAGRNQVCF
jgi:diguanylate cyclase (GGDEF)-like protein/PAS domain S-box-containing protein